MLFIILPNYTYIPRADLLPININLDNSLYSQIRRILSNFSESVMNKCIKNSEKIRDININKIVKDTENKCYTEISNMEYFERRNFLKKYKIKNSEKI